MNEEYRIVNIGEPGDAEWSAIGPGVGQYNKQRAGDTKHQSLCFVLRAADESIVGGVIGATYWDWLYVDLLWLQEEFRGQGYGHRLLEAAEKEARKRGAKNAYLDTFSFQAPDFYEQHGYQVFGTLEGFPAGHRRFFFQKEL